MDLGSPQQKTRQNGTIRLYKNCVRNCSMAPHYTHTRSVRSEKHLLFPKLSAKLTSVGGKSLGSRGVGLLNNLPLYIRATPTLLTFRKKIQTKLFTQTFNCQPARLTLTSLCSLDSHLLLSTPLFPLRFRTVRLISIHLGSLVLRHRFMMVSGAQEIHIINQSITLKTEDLEGRSQRNNIRILGLIEGAESNKMEHFLEYMLPKVLGNPSFTPQFVIERAHRSPGKRPLVGAPPMSIIARLLNYRDRPTPPGIKANGRYHL